MLEAKNKYIVVEEIKPETTTKTGIIVSDSDKTNIIKGKVIGAFNEFTNEIVIFLKYDAIPVFEDGKEYLLIKSEKILSIIK